MSKFLSFVPLSMYNVAAFLRSQLFLLPVLLFFYQENGLSVGDFYLIQGLIVFFAFLFEIPAGYLGDIFPRKYILIFAYALFLARLFLWIFFRGFEIILIGEFFYACSKACFDSVSSSFIYDILKKNNEEAKMVKAYSNFNASMYIGTGIAALLGAGLYEKLGSHVLLIAEFIIYSTAILLLSMLPNAHRPMKENVIAIKERLKKFWVAVRYILKSRKYCYLVLFSGFMVGVSHFFFWSFQPLMKSSGINPSVSLTDLADSIGWDARVFGEATWNYLVSLDWLDYIKVMGVVIFINNVIRSSFSYFAASVAKKVSLFKLGNISFGMEIIGCALSFVLMKMGHITPLNCLYFIIFLCICIGLQLMFTISHISRLHRLINPKIRSLSSSVNMMTGRLLTSLMLMAPKFLLKQEGTTAGIGVIDIFWIYAIVFVPIGLYFIYKIYKYNVNSEHSLMNVGDDED
ncbi:MAG: MFS transporter [Alphaproteobacteria bacterium]|nr:MFS transporter [Alphaproteobacteria bacterium]